MIERDAAHTDRAARVVEAARQHEAALLGYLGRMLGDADEAADVLQDTLERALDGRRPLPSDSELRPWLYRVATNRAIDVIRRRRFTATWTAEPAIGRTTEGEVEDRVLLKAVAAFVRGLPPKQRAALVMRRYQGLSYQEIARALGCSEESARANAYQALRRLRSHFSEDGWR